VLWLKQIAPNLVPIMTIVNDPKRGQYIAIRWKRPDEPMPEPETPYGWRHLIPFLNEQMLKLYDAEAHKLRGDPDALSFFIQVAEALPEGYPLKGKVVMAALLHGLLMPVWWWLPEKDKKWLTDTIEGVDARLPSPPEPQKPYSEDFEPEPLPSESAKEMYMVLDEWYERMKGEWAKWAKERYGDTKPEKIKDGIVHRLTDKLASDKEFVDAFINSPFNVAFATTEDALERQEALKSSLQWVISGLIGVWAQTSSDEHPLSYALQIAVAQEFGLKENYEFILKWLEALEEHTPGITKHTAILYNTLKPILHKFVRAVYEETQDFLSKSGLTEIYLIRGLRLPEDRAEGLSWERYQLFKAVAFPVSSWSLDQKTARNFATLKSEEGKKPVLYVLKLPKSAFPYIFSTALTGWGCFDEAEFVLMLPINQKVWAAEWVHRDVLLGEQ